MCSSRWALTMYPNASRAHGSRIVQLLPFSLTRSSGVIRSPARSRFASVRRSRSMRYPQPSISHTHLSVAVGWGGWKYADGNSTARFGSIGDAGREGRPIEDALEGEPGGVETGEKSGSYVRR